mmetsp:Transcript_63907/g.147152  ORF Transcript_63907/g.147152 Transcript_63907/m.147152 type:complete len:285 (-) Transcript_63907:775-1629(-)
MRVPHISNIHTLQRCTFLQILQRATATPSVVQTLQSDLRLHRKITATLSRGPPGVTVLVPPLAVVATLIGAPFPRPLVSVLPPTPPCSVSLPSLSRRSLLSIILPLPAQVGHEGRVTLRPPPGASCVRFLSRPRNPLPCPLVPLPLPTPPLRRPHTGGLRVSCRKATHATTLTLSGLLLCPLLVSFATVDLGLPILLDDVFRLWIAAVAAVVSLPSLLLSTPPLIVVAVAALMDWPSRFFGVVLVPCSPIAIILGVPLLPGILRLPSCYRCLNLRRALCWCLVS